MDEITENALGQLVAIPKAYIEDYFKNGKGILE